MSTVTQYLTDHEIEFRSIEHHRATTALAEARAVGVPADAVAKTLVLDTKRGHALAVIPASRRIDLDRAAAAIGEPYVHLATEREISRDLAAYELGAIPPLPGLVGMPVFVDPQVAAHDEVIFAAGAQTESIAMPISSLLDDPWVRVAGLCEPERTLDDAWE